MKKISLFTLVFCFTITMTFAGKYEKAMTEAIQKLYKSQDQQSYIDASGTFERIGAAEKDEWLPFYYAGLGYIWASHTTQDGKKIDEYLDQAQFFVDKAKKLSPENDEIITLQGYIYMMKVAVDPASRGQEYSSKAMQAFGKAASMNADNPRALLLLGRMQMGTDQFFGNDISDSCNKITKASEMLEMSSPASKLEPTWGKEMVEIFLKECKSN